MAKTKWYSILAIVLVLVGALNWGLVGIFDFNLVTWLFGLFGASATGVIVRLVYTLVGVSGVIAAYEWLKELF
jgi:uncharacterized membrane protein YuzA (DUF378 family)